MIGFFRFTGNTFQGLLGHPTHEVVRLGSGRWQLVVRYGARRFAALGRVNDLIDLVLDARAAHCQPMDGPFLINEYRSVIVPAVEGLPFNAGRFDDVVEFDINAHAVSGLPLSRHGRRLLPGDRWEGLHTGVLYHIDLVQGDISYEDAGGSVVRLSTSSGSGDARAVCTRLARSTTVIPPFVVVNEYGAIFCRNMGHSSAFVYLGSLQDLEAWFPEPTPRGPIASVCPPVQA